MSGGCKDSHENVCLRDFIRSSASFLCRWVKYRRGGPDWTRFSKRTPSTQRKVRVDHPRVTPVGIGTAKPMGPLDGSG